MIMKNEINGDSFKIAWIMDFGADEHDEMNIS